jgi:hypothetical protein
VGLNRIAVAAPHTPALCGRSYCMDLCIMELTYIYNKNPQNFGLFRFSRIAMAVLSDRSHSEDKI